MKLIAAIVLTAAALLGAPQAIASQTADAPHDGARVLVFWASWCGACKPLLADLKAAEQDLSALGARIETVGIDGKASPVALPAADAALIEALKAEHGVRALPWVVVVDAGGKVLATPSAHHSPTQLTPWLKADLALTL